jgi:hypothetical protein
MRKTGSSRSADGARSVRHDAQMPFHLRALVALAVAVASAGCGAGSESSAPSGSAQAMLTRVQHELRAKGTGLIDSSVGHGVSTYTDDTGTYDLDLREFGLTRRYRHGEEVELRIVAGAAYYRFEEQLNPDGCWLRLEPGEIAQMDLGMSPGLGPAAVTGVLTASTAAWSSDGALEVEIPAPLALQLLAVPSDRYAQLDGLDDVMVRATVGMRKRHLQHFLLAGGDVARSVRDLPGGAELAESLYPLRAFTTFQLGLSTTVAPPPSDALVGPDCRLDPEAFRAPLSGQ